jgi:hypothetical protein
VATAKERAAFQLDARIAFSVAFSPDGKTVGSAGHVIPAVEGSVDKYKDMRGVVKLWELPTSNKPDRD